MLKNNQGEWVDNPDDLKTLVQDHFSSIYSSLGQRDFSDVLDCIQPVVNSSMSLHLEAPVTQIEIDKAVKHMGAHKASRVDGFPGIFFQKYWHIVGKSVSDAIKQFFNNSMLPSSLNKTSVVDDSKGPIS